MKKNHPSRNADGHRSTVHQGALLVCGQQSDEGLALRLAEGESWNGQAMHLALLVSGESLLSTLLATDKDPDGCPGRRIRQATIRRNSFTPEFEPSRHEMRIFDALDGIVTEM
ncbi:MAG: hypothetical protein RI601_09635 [Desulfurivibrionaceae bacterium]|nr:hypothetical protein [Desulfurivibrionaceae bacterium]